MVTSVDQFKHHILEATGLIAFMSDPAFKQQNGFSMTDYFDLRRSIADSIRETGNHIKMVVRDTGIAKPGFFWRLSLGLTIGGLAGGVASAATNVTAEMVKAGHLNADSKTVRELLEFIKSKDLVVFTLLQQLEALTNKMGELREKDPSVQAWLKDERAVTKWTLTIGYSVVYRSFKVAETTAALAFAKVAAAVFRGTRGLGKEAAKMITAPALPFGILKSSVVAGGTAAKIFSASFAVAGIGFGIWDVVDGAADINSSETAMKCYDSADALDSATNEISDALDLYGGRKQSRYAIKSASSSQYLDGRAPGMSDVSLASGNRDPASDKYLQFRVETLGNGVSAIKSVSSCQYLDGRAPGMSDVTLASGERDPASDKYLQWCVVRLGNGLSAIQSISSGQYLDGRAPGMSDVLLANADRDPASDIYLQWNLMQL
ncbi:hypothetical protein HDU98_007938 [Podochytrium sp. JEL0797]|nr:hypothetical protein HDU98_007938 [Podochytrium sp. JEL0797]